MAQILNFAFSNQCYKKYITYTSLYINKYIYILFVGEILLTAVGSLNQHVAELRGGGAMRIWQQLPAVAPRDLDDLRQQCLLPGYGCRGLGDGRGERGGQGLGMDDFGHFFPKFPPENEGFTGKSDRGKDVATFGNCGSRWQMTV
jgi:hypothetical protein